MKKINNKNVIKWISQVSGKNKIYVLILLVIQIAVGISGVVYSLFLRNIINSAVDHDRSGFFGAVMCFVMLICFQIVLHSIRRYLEELSRSSLENKFKANLFGNLLSKEYKAVTAIHSAEWINRLTSDATIVADGLTQILPELAKMVVSIIGALTVIIIFENRFLYILAPVGILLVLLTYLFRRKLKKLHVSIQEQDGKLRTLFQEMLESMIVIRAFAVEDAVADTVGKQMNTHKKARMNKNRFHNICNIGFSVIINGVYVSCAMYLGFGILTGRVSYGTFTAILQLIGYVQAPFANISSVVSRFFAMLASAERLMQIEAHNNLDKPSRSSVQVHSFYDSEFCGFGIEHGYFSYDSLVSDDNPAEEIDNEQGNKITLDDINLDISKGEYVAFVGPSGCGKSTLLKLLLSVYDLNSGSLFLRTHDSTIPLDRNWQRLFAYVPQGNHLMSGTIREIVAFFDNEKASQSELVMQSLKVACADEFVSELENGIDTPLGEHGFGLSEGQVQRLAIARAVFSDAPILMLDESTSALDDEVEERLLSNLKNMTDKTVLIITHRTAVLKICDKVVEISDSKCSVTTIQSEVINNGSKSDQCGI